MSRVHPAGPLHADVLPEDHPAGPADDLNALEPAVWPRSAKRDDGVLTIGGVDVRDLAREYGTPLYVYDEEDVRSRAREYAAAFHDGSVHYAGKAFLCTAVARWLNEEGLGLDVCSGGELAVALAAGFPHGAHHAAREQQVVRGDREGARGRGRADRARLVRGDRPGGVSRPGDGRPAQGDGARDHWGGGAHP